jgi:glucokinase
MSEQRRLALGVDLGGTTIKVGVVTHQGEIIGRGHVATEAHLGVAGVIANLARAAHMAMEDARVSVSELGGVGIGAPGICNGAEGVVVEAVNLAWYNVAVTDLLGGELGLPACLDNDANCAALGEQWCGAARGSRHMLMVTLGTGVGGGLIMDGKIYHGFRGWAGEFGHMPAVENGPHCNCGHYGCLETVASATAMAAAARRAIESGAAPFLTRMAREQEGKVDARLVIYAARDGDPVALGIIQDVAGHLGNALGGLVSALNPELIVVGGGASTAGEMLLEPLRTAILEKGMPGPAAVAKVVAAELGNNAGLIGAASLVWR